MVEAATEFRKNGFNDSDAATLAKTATMFQNVSDEAISAGDSASFIISQMIAFGIEAKDAQSIIDKVNQTSNEFSVSSGDLAQALGIVASTSSAMGNSLDETLGMVVAMTEQTRSASKSARGLNTIASRLSQVLDDTSDTGAKLTTIYNDLGISLKDSSGQLRSTYDILSDLHGVWNTLDTDTQKYIALTSAGTNQLNNFLALMNNFDHAADATATSLNSAGSAMKENEAYMDSLDAKTNQLKAEFQDLANNVIDKELVGGFLDLGEVVLKFANTDLGQLITKITLLSGIGWGAESLLSVSHIFQTIGSQFKNFGTIISTAVSGSSSLATAITGIGGAAGMALPICIALGTAIVGIYEAVKAYKASHPDFETAQQSVDNLSDSLKTSQERLDEINTMDWKDRTRAINAEKEELEGLIEQEERELQVAKMRQAMAAGKELSGRTGYGEATRYTAISPRDTDNQTFTSMDEAIKTLAETEGIAGDSTDELKAKLLDLGYAFVTTTENTKLTADEMNALDTQTLRDLTNSIKENGELNTNLSDSYQGLYEQLAPTYEKIVNLEKAYASAIPGSRALTDSERELKGAFEELVGTMVSFDSAGESAYQIIANLANILGVTPQYAKDLAVSMGMVSANTQVAAGTFEQLADGTWTVAEQMKEIADSVGSTSTLFAQYETILSSYQDTVDGVAGASDRFVSSLFNQNGELTEAARQALSTDSAMAGMASSIITAQQAQAQANFSVLIQAIQDVGSAAMITSQQIASMMAMAGVNIGGASAASVSSNLARTYKEITGKTAASNEAAYKAWLQEYVYNKYQNKLDEYKKQLDELKDYVPSGGGGGGGSSKSAEEKAAEEAEKQAKKAQQAQEKAAKESQQAYESAAKSAEQAAQEAARAAEQAAEQAKQKILDTISELKDASDDFWTSKTDAVEETNTELDRQKQLEEKLKALEEAKQKKILLYKNGQFQYDKDYGSIAKAQADYEETRDKIHREKELEQLKEMKDNATEIFNEMKDIINNGGNVTQDMIDKWLKNMAALGVDYYDSNKTILNEWLDWAKGAITEFGQGALDAIGGYTSTGSYLSGASYGGAAIATETNGARYAEDPMYWDAEGNFVGFSVAFWIDRFKKEISSGFKPEEWLGGGLGTSVFDDWAEALTNAAVNSLDPSALEDIAERAKAAQIVLSNYKWMFDSLGYEEYAKIAERAESMDISEYKRLAKMQGAVTNPDNPFGWSSISPADMDTIEGKLYNILENISTYQWLTGSRETGRGSATDDLRYGSKFVGDERDASYTQASDDLGYGKFTPRVRDVVYNMDDLQEFYEDNEKAIADLQELWYKAETDLERQTIHLEAEARRQARDYAEELLGMSPTGKSEAEREANRLAGSRINERRRQERVDDNIDSIKNVLDESNKEQKMSASYIDEASDYIAKTIEDNIAALEKAYTDTEKEKLKAQNEQLQALQDELVKMRESSNVIDSEGRLDWETTDFDDVEEDWVRSEADDLSEREAAIREEMRKNSEAWWDAETDAERDALHKRNEELAKEIEGLEYDAASGVWSKNATGTHNFIPKHIPSNMDSAFGVSHGISLVGEKGPELRLLRRGDNIIPANQTANLWKWSTITPQAMLSTLSARQGGGNTSYAFDVSRIELPNVTDAKSFVNGLKNYALQYSYKR